MSTSADAYFFLQKNSEPINVCFTEFSSSARSVILSKNGSASFSDKTPSAINCLTVRFSLLRSILIALDNCSCMREILFSTSLCKCKRSSFCFSSSKVELLSSSSNLISSFCMMINPRPRSYRFPMVFLKYSTIQLWFFAISRKCRSRK